MAGYYVPLPAARIDPQNALLNLGGVNAGLNAVRDQSNENRNALMRQTQLDMQKEQQQYQRGRDQKQDARQEVQWFGEQSAAVDRMQGPQRAQAWQTILARHGTDGLSPEELDPVTGPKLLMAAAGKWRDPRDDRMKDLELQGAEARIGLTRAQTVAAQRALDPNADYKNRLAQLQAAGLDPNSADGRHFALTGKLPAASFEQAANKQRRSEMAPTIASGLQNLNAMADKYDDTAFDAAVGPYAGATPDGLAGAIPINIARGVGEIKAALGGANAAPSEVRNDITGATEALAAAIKPLIRGPGEGVWTDQDQARLVSIVGDLAQSRNKTEYRRRLNAVRDRIRANFNLDIPFDALQQMAPAPQTSGNDGWTSMGNGIRIREKR